MAYSQLGYPYSYTPQFPSGCLEPEGRSPMDTITPPSHLDLSCPVYESSALHSPGQELTPTPDIGVYSSAYPKSQGYYSTCSSGAAAVYSMGALGSKEEAVSSRVRAPQTPAYYPYDYAFGQYSYERYGYTCSDAASRRKNATRETTSTLKTWLQEHQKNPYPTKGEKIMLAIITKMTLTQVSTWFANARRRLKKENKVTWSPRANRNSDDRGRDGEDSDGEEEPLENLKCVEKARPGVIQSDTEDFDLLESEGSDCEPKLPFYADFPTTGHSTLRPFKDEVHENERLTPKCPKHSPEQHGAHVFHPEHDHGVIEAKPKIWSIAQTAVSLNPAVQLDYLPCMLLSDGASSTKCSSHVDPTATGGQQDSPVTSLREWVDGVFHESLFQQRPFTRAQPKPADTWKGSSFENTSVL